MAWQIRSTATNVAVGGSTPTVTVTIPANVQPGDYILETVVAVANNVTQTPPAGWTAIPAISAGTTSSSLRGAYRRAQPGDANTLTTFSLNSSTRWAVVLTVVYDDAGGVPRIEQVANNANNAQTVSPPTPAIDPVNSDDLLLAVFGGAPQTNGVTAILTANANFTLEAQAGSASGTLKNGSIAVASMVLSNGDPLGIYTHGTTPSIAALGASILISSHNTAPTANAGPDQTVNPGAFVTLDGSGSSDFDGSLTAYAWTQISGPTVTLSNATVVQPTFTAPSSVEASVLVFGLIVTDDEGTPSTQDTVTINVGAMSFEHVWDGAAMHKQPIRHWVGDIWVS